MRPRQPPSARRVIVSALPEVRGMAQVSELHPVLASHAITEADKMLRAKVRALCELRFDLVRCLNQAVVTAEEMGADSRGPMFFSLLSVAGVTEHYVTTEIRALRGYFYQKARSSKPVQLRDYYAMVGTDDSDLKGYVGSELPAFESLETLMAAGLVTDKPPPRPPQGRRARQREPRPSTQPERAQDPSPKTSESNRGRASFRARGRGGRSV